MKLIKVYMYTIVSIISSIMFISCTKSFDEKTIQQTDFNNNTLAQVVIATVGATRNYVYIDGIPVTGAALAAGSVFPASAYAFSVPAGLHSYQIRDTLSTSTQVPLNFAENMQVGKNYTIFMYDTTTSPKQITVPTNIEIPSDTSARLRFANFVYNPTGITAFDIFSVKKNANIFTNIQVTQVTDFIQYPSGITDTFYIRPAGTTTNLQNYKPTAPVGFLDIMAVLTPTEKRSYTLIFRGGYRATVTTNATVRTLTTFINH